MLPSIKRVYLRSYNSAISNDVENNLLHAVVVSSSKIWSMVHNTKPMQSRTSITFVTFNVSDAYA